jgi:hypothetical protein
VRPGETLTSVVMVRAPMAPEWVVDGDHAAVDVGLGEIRAYDLCPARATATPQAGMGG